LTPPIRLFANALDGVREKIVPFEAERFLNASCRITGLSDYGDDPDFRPKVERITASLNQVDFNLIGRFAVRTMMHWHLVNRLNVIETIKRHPEILDSELEDPIVVVGLFRTGTTFLHNVLAADPSLQAGQTWQFAYPAGRKRAPLADVGWRKRRTNIPLTMNHAIVPDQDVVHYVSRENYEEDFFLMGTDMTLMTQIVGLGDWDYAWRLMDEDLSEAYRWHKIQLQILSAQSSNKRWVLKCPWHLWNLDSLLKIYPNAKIIHTHRDVSKAIGSHCSLAARIVCRMHRDVPAEEIAKFWVDYSVAGMRNGLAAKDTLPTNQRCDVRLNDLRVDPAGELRKIYAQLELPFSDSLHDAFRLKAASDPTFQHGIHEYNLADYGLTPEGVLEKFGDYADRFGV
jgi:hypothetical protein